MTREHKLGLILIFSVALAIAVVISDHFSVAQSEPMAPEEVVEPLVLAPSVSDGAPAYAHTDNGAARQAPAPRAWGAPQPAEPQNLVDAGRAALDAQRSAVRDPLVFDQGRDGGLTSALQTARASAAREPDPQPEPEQMLAMRDEALGGADDGGPSDGVRGKWSAGGRLRDNFRSLKLPPALQLGSTPQAESGSDSVTNPRSRPAISSPPRERRVAVPTDRMRVVVEGDSLYTICAEEYGDGGLWPKLAAYNEGRVGKKGGVRAGVTLRVPARSRLTGETTRPAENTDIIPQRRADRSPAAERPSSERAGRVYVVQKGDMLGEIARRELGSSTRWREIVDLNNLENPDRIVVGTKLKLPAK